MVGEEGLEPSESKTTDLQSAPLPVTVYSPIECPPKFITRIGGQRYRRG